MTSLVKWDVRVLRSWHPYYYLTGGRVCPEPVPPVQVNMDTEWDDDSAALEFERRIREILEEMS